MCHPTLVPPDLAHLGPSTSGLSLGPWGPGMRAGRDSPVVPGPRSTHPCSLARTRTHSRRACPDTCLSRRGCWHSHPGWSHSWVLGGTWWSALPRRPAPPHPRPRTCGPLGTEADVGIVAVLAGAPVAAGLAVALVDVGLAVVARVAWLAQAGEGGHPVTAGPVVAGVGVALVDVHLTVGPSVACRVGAKVLRAAAPGAHNSRSRRNTNRSRHSWHPLGRAGGVSLTVGCPPHPGQSSG